MTSTLVADVKRVATTGQGIVTAYASIFGNVDRMNERVVKGAFARSLAEWAVRGTKIPFLWSHGDGIRDVVGAVTRAEEDATGLKVTAQLDIDGSDEASMLFGQIKSGAISQYSFAYAVRNSRVAKDGVRELLDLDLLEVSACVAGANPETRTIATKSAAKRIDPVKAADDNPENWVFRVQYAKEQLLGTKSDDITSRIDALAGTSDAALLARLGAQCAEHGIAPPPSPEPARKRDVYAAVGSLTGAPAGPFGMPALGAPEPDTRRLIVSPGMTTESLTEQLEAAEQRADLAAKEHADADRALAAIRARVAAYDDRT